MFVYNLITPRPSGCSFYLMSVCVSLPLCFEKSNKRPETLSQRADWQAPLLSVIFQAALQNDVIRLSLTEVIVCHHQPFSNLPFIFFLYFFFLLSDCWMIATLWSSSTWHVHISAISGYVVCRFFSCLLYFSGFWQILILSKFYLSLFTLHWKCKE